MSMQDPLMRGLLWQSMAHLSKEERQEAVEMLTFIGLMSSGAARGSGLGSQIVLSQPHGHELVKPLEQPRANRRNSIDHFPFADDYGSVASILKAKDCSIPLTSMGAPARAKVIKVAYDKMLSGRKYMKICDIPEAFADLDILVPLKVMSILYSIGIELESVNLAKNTNVSITPDQFIRLVEICINPRQRASNKGRDIDFYPHEGYVYNDDDRSEVSFSSGFAADKPYDDRVVSRPSKQQLDNILFAKHHHAPPRDSRRREGAGGDRGGLLRETHASRLKKARSKISDDVEADRVRFRDTLRKDNGGRSSSGRAVSSPAVNYRDARPPPLATPTEQQKPAPTSPVRISTQHIGYNESSDDVESMSSVIESAEKFLRNSPKSKISTGATTTSSSLFAESSSAKDAFSSDIAHRGRMLAQSPGRSLSPRGRGDVGFNSQLETNNKVGLEKVSLSPRSGGGTSWHATAGGWVADFGHPAPRSPLMQQQQQDRRFVSSYSPRASAAGDYRETLSITLESPSTASSSTVTGLEETLNIHVDRDRGRSVFVDERVVASSPSPSPRFSTTGPISPSVSGVLTGADPFDLHRRHFFDSRASFEKELLAKQRTSSSEDTVIQRGPVAEGSFSATTRGTLSPHHLPPPPSSPRFATKDELGDQIEMMATKAAERASALFARTSLGRREFTGVASTVPVLDKELFEDLFSESGSSAAGEGGDEGSKSDSSELVRDILKRNKADLLDSTTSASPDSSS